MKKTKIYAPLLIPLILTTTLSYAEPSKPISKMLRKPVSAFDLFLYQLHERTKCTRDWYGMLGERPKICVAYIEYHFDDNIIEMNFVLSSAHKEKDAFVSASDEEKKFILKRILADLADRVGVAGKEGGLR